MTAPRQNRVDPFSRIHAVADHGTLMGNRGCLHDVGGRIVRPQTASRAWITCLPAWRERRRTLMTPGTYTELFFLDEATALAAGHRPCFECRRDRAKAFATSWAAGQGRTDRPPVTVIDAVLHAERVAARPEDAGTPLPDGAMIGRPADGAAWLHRGGAFLRWSFAGYGAGERRRPSGTVLLTPRSVVAALAAGYRPALHGSAG